MSLLTMRGIAKSFSGIPALSGVDLQVDAGEVLALCGENGAGKSTLMKILSGLYPSGSYEGEIAIAGTPQRFRGIRDAERAGIAIIYQELALVRELTVAENLFLGHEPCRWPGILDWDRMISQSQRLLQEVGLDVSPTTKLGDLGIGQQQMVEIAKALSKEARVLVLDEPTASLADHESRTLLDLIRKLRNRGVACILISHKLDEVMAVADRVTVLRDGVSVATHAIDQVTEDAIVRLMVGRELKDRYPRARRDPGPVTLEVSDWTVEDRSDSRRRACQGVHFKAQSGEVLGIAGLVGSGRSELLESLFGAYQGRRLQGTIQINGSPVRIRSPRDAIAAGLTLVTEDRKGSGLVLDASIIRNIGLTNPDRLSRGGLIDPDAEVQLARHTSEELALKSPSLEAMVKTLSGGNQQKVVLAKWLARSPEVLLLDEPTRGIDVGAKFELYALIDRLVAEGMCVVMVSSDLGEILGMSDRVLVMREGKIAGELPASQASQEAIMHLATGGTRGSHS